MKQSSFRSKSEILKSENIDPLAFAHGYLSQDGNATNALSTVASDCARQRTKRAAGAGTYCNTYPNKESSSEQTQPRLTPVFIDWLSLSWVDTRINFYEPLELESVLAQLMTDWTGHQVLAVSNGKGLLGFDNSTSLVVMVAESPVLLGQVAFGGQQQGNRVLMQINGTGCSKIRDFAKVKDMVEALEARINRVDLSVDDYDGLHVSFDKALDWFQSGDFKTPGAKGLPAKYYKTVGDTLQLTGTGRTLYVGRRGTGKLARIYEKGCQLGQKFSKWTRFEVELTHRNRDIPVEVLTNPAPYFAGTYQCAASLLDVIPTVIKKKVEQVSSFVRETAEEAVLQITQSVKAAKKQAGNLINFLRSVLEFSDEQIVQCLGGHKIPPKLSNASLHVIDDSSWFSQWVRTPQPAFLSGVNHV